MFNKPFLIGCGQLGIPLNNQQKTNKNNQNNRESIRLTWMTTQASEVVIPYNFQYAPILQMILQYLAFMILYYGAYIYGTGFFQYSPNADSSNPIIIPTRPNQGKFIFVLLDGLRSDFDLELRMSHTVYNTTAHSPTVTLPRLKALLLGNIPSFIESWQYSPNNQHISNWLSEYLTNKKGLFFGDSTWSQLIPISKWSVYEPVTSFHATDTTQCDLNVTSNVQKYLNTDYDVMVLHYLGLDHIGHSLHGPQSPLFLPKLREYSAIIHQIYNTMSDNDVMVVLGDHGMTNSGEHGGSSLNETSTKSIFISKSLPHVIPTKSYYQIDMVPLFAYLTSGFIGTMNKGTPPMDLINKEHQNTVKLALNNTKATESNVYNLELLRNGLVFMILGLFPSFVELVLDGSVITMDNNKVKFVSDYPSHTFPFILYALVYTGTLWSSSLIEEEHILHYFALMTITITFIVIRLSAVSSNTLRISNLFSNPNIGIPIVLRIIQNINQTGDKWSHQWDYGTYMEHHMVLTTILASALVLLKYKKWGLIVVFLKLTNILDLGSTAEMALLCLSLIKCDLGLVVLIFTHTRNIPILVILMFLLPRMPNNKYSPLIYYILHKYVYFVIGNSNKLSTIDISSAFIGLEDMHFILSPIYTFLTVYGPSLYVMIEGMNRNGVQVSKYTQLMSCYSFFGITFVSLFMRDHLFIWSVFTPRLVYEYGWQIVTIIISIYGLLRPLLITLKQIFKLHKIEKQTAAKTKTK